MAEREITVREVAPYIPRCLLRWYNSAGPGSAHLVSGLNGILMCMDASGFTALTEALKQRGRGGPEFLTTILNKFFEEMARVVFSFDGDILKFAGDALWVYLPSSCNLAEFHHEALDGLKHVNSSDSLTRDNPLTVHIGAELGELNLLSLGSHETRVEIEPFGALVNKVYQICDDAGTNQLFAGPHLAGAQEEFGVRFETVGRSRAVVPQERASATPTSSRIIPETSDDFCSKLENYLPADVVTKLKSMTTDSNLQSEHRQVVAMFVHFVPVALNRSSVTASSVSELNKTICEMFENIRSSGGSIARIDPYHDGHKLLALYGAPKKHGDDELRAIACAQKLAGLHSPGFQLRIGEALGALFCGDVGATARREYTVMGSAANMAARLMSKAVPGEVLVDSQLRDRLPAQILTEEKRFELKGIAGRTSAHALVDIGEVEISSLARDELIGQRYILDSLKTLWQEAQEGAARVVCLTGPPGVGKSHITRVFHSETLPAGSQYIAGDNATLFGRGWLIRKFLGSLRDDAGSHDAQSIIEWCETIVGARWRPLLGEMVGELHSDNQWTRGLTVQLRENKIRELFCTVVNNAAREPRGYVIDDLDKTDELSQSLMFSLASGSCKAPLLVVVTGKRLAAPDCPSARLIGVEPPDRDSWLGWFDRRFESGKREREFIDRLLGASNGNPLVALDSVERFRERGRLAINRVSGKMEVVADGGEIEFPDSFIDAHLARFDSLPESSRELLKRASIVQGWFESSWLFGDGAESKRTISTVAHGTTGEQSILAYNDETDKYAFRQSSMREAVYSCIPESERTALHLLRLNTLLNKGEPVEPAILAFHAHAGMDFLRAFGFSLRAAHVAFEAYALNEAADHLRRCEEALARVNRAEIDDEELYDFYHLRVKSLSLAGRYSELYRVCRLWRRRARQSGRPHEILQAALTTAQTLWKQARYSRSKRIMTALLESPELQGNNSLFAAASSIMADIERRAGNFAGACDWCRRAILLATEAGDTIALADAQNKLGLNLWGMGELESAIDEFNKSLSTGEQVQGEYARARTTNNLGIVHFSMGHFPDAERSLAKSLEAFDSIGDIRNEAYSSGNLANICRVLGKFARSRELFERADVIFERLNDEHAHHYTVGNLGDIDLICGALSDAELRFRQAAEFAAKVEDKELAAECDVRFGELAFFKGNMRAAAEKYEQAIDGARAIGSKEWLMRAEIGLTRVSIYERDHKRVESLIEEVLNLAGQSNAVISKYEILFLTGESRRIAGKEDEALKFYQKTLQYALDESLFELKLKAALRIRALDRLSKSRMDEILRSVAETFMDENSRSLWAQILNSAYFSFFADDFADVFSEFLSPHSHKV